MDLSESTSIRKGDSMENQYDIKAIINFIAGFVFFLLMFIGTIGLFQAIGDYYPLDNQTFAFASFFIVGAIGLMSQLHAYNTRSEK